MTHTRTITKPKPIEAPALDHDAMMLKRYCTPLNADGKRERRIVANLIHHMQSNGFRVHSVWDGEELTKFGPEQPSQAALKEAMELIFNLDEVSLRFVCSELDEDDEHGVLLVMGNDMDIIADWNSFKDDRDGFDATMEAFNAEDFA